MNTLMTQLVRSDIGLELSDITETQDMFSVRTRMGGPKIIFALLFGIPGLMLLLIAITSPNILTLCLALIFCPVMLFMAVLFGFSVSEKILDKKTNSFIDKLSIFNFSFDEVLPLPVGQIVMKSENRGSSKTGSGSSILYTISIPGTIGCGFALSRDYFAMKAFAERLSQFLSLPVVDDVLEVNRIKR